MSVTIWNRSIRGGRNITGGPTFCGYLAFSSVFSHRGSELSVLLRSATRPTYAEQKTKIAAAGFSPGPKLHKIRYFMSHEHVSCKFFMGSTASISALVSVHGQVPSVLRSSQPPTLPLLNFLNFPSTNRRLTRCSSSGWKGPNPSHVQFPRIKRVWPFC